MKTKQPLAEEIVPICSLDAFRRPLNDDEIAELLENEAMEQLSQLSGYSNLCQAEKEDLEQLVCFLIWKRIEREMLDEHSGSIPLFEQQLDSFADLFDRTLR